MGSPAKEPNFIKLMFGEGESGWAIDLEDGTAEINNVPLEGRLNLGDVVKIEKVDSIDHRGPVSFRKAGELVRRKYAFKTGFEYEADKEVAQKIADAARALGWHAEGMVLGMMMLARPAGSTMDELKAKIGGIELRNIQECLEVPS